MIFCLWLFLLCFLLSQDSRMKQKTQMSNALAMIMAGIVILLLLGLLAVVIAGMLT